jgi:pimeloyl-ACP methyl ester carboxylesterase
MFGGGQPLGRSRAALADGLAVAALILAACGSGGSSSQQKPGGVPAGLQKFYDQKLSWGACPPEAAVATGAAASGAAAAQAVAGFQCTTLTVPLDYARPGGSTIKLVMNRLPATDQAQRIGPLLTNPGGPGESGVGFAFAARSFFTPQLRARYDIVGLDPRGVGLSSPVQCKLTGQPQQQANPVMAATQLAQACQKTSGKVLPYVGTDNAARDMDIARAALGASRLDYYGASYGTLLGQVYAQMFPHDVGRMVLDSIDDPTGAADPTTQALGFETTFRVLVQGCINRGSCPLGSSQNAVQDRFDSLLSRLRSSPLPTGPGSPPLTADVLINYVQQNLYSEKQWPSIEATLGALFRGVPTGAPNGAQPGGQALRSLAGSAGNGEVSGSFPAIECLTVPSDQRTVAAARRAGQEAQAVAPHFYLAVENQWLQCAKWPVPSPSGAGRTINAPGTPTILLVGNTFDPATPVAWARAVHGQLANSVLVTNTAGGHGFYPMGSCTHKVVDDFLISGRKPAPGTACHDRNPALAPPVSSP